LGALVAVTLGCGGGGDAITDAFEDFGDDIVNDFEDRVNDFEDVIEDFDGSDDDRGDASGALAPASLDGRTLTQVDDNGIVFEFAITSPTDFAFTSVEGDGRVTSGAGSYSYAAVTDTAATYDYTVSSGEAAGVSGVLDLVFTSPSGGTYSGTFTDGTGNTSPDSGAFGLD